MNTAERWQYLANAPAPVIQAIQEWIDEYDALNRAFQTLIQSIKDLERVFAPPHAFVAYPCIEKNLRQMRIVSELTRLLILQDQFFDLTLDYARFIDAHVNAPTSFDDLIGTWDMLDHELNAIESATLQRDQALHPDDPPKPARQVIDIPR